MIDFTLQQKQSEEVYHSLKNMFSLGKADINNLISLAKKSKRRRVRFCSHSTPQKLVHEMFIVHPKGAYVRPHKHINKSESMFVIEGVTDYIIFEDSGQIKDIISLGDYRSGKAFYQNTGADLYHTLRIQSEWLVFLEITQGPFKKKDTIYAKWSPNEQDEIAGKIFLNDLILKRSKNG